MIFVEIARAGLPLDIVEARNHVRMDSTEDAKILRSIRALTAFAETECQRTLVATRWRLALDGFAPKICLLRGPVRQVVSLKYRDTNNVWQTLPPSQYDVNLTDEPATIVPAWGCVWPPTLPLPGAVQVIYDAGDVARISTNATSDTITVLGNWPALALQQPVRFSNSGGALPAGLALDTDFFIDTAPSAGVYTVAATAGGPAIDITDAGSGTSYLGTLPSEVLEWMLLRLADLFDNRGSQVSLKIQPHPWIDRLLDSARIELA